jgi:hypothetical protein
MTVLSRRIPVNTRLGRLLLACALATTVASPSAAQDWVQYSDVLPTAHTLSPELRSLPNAPAHVGTVSNIPIRHRPSFVPGGRPSAPDPVAQTTPGSPLSTSSGIGFDGVAFNGYYPPDPNISVSDTQIVQTTNVELAVYDKSGTLLKGPVSLSSLFSGLSNLCSTTNGGDPIVLWDKIAHRWLISQLAFTSNLRSNYVCIAVSQGSDATGAYNVYAFSSSRLPDYPKFGVWSSSDTDGASDYYMSANLFSTSFYYGPLVCAFNGGDMQAGRTARFACVQGTTSHFSLLPADVDGSTAPAKGEPSYFLELGTGISSSSGNTLELQAFKATWTTTGGSLNSPTTVNISVPTYALACGNGGTCIPQPQTSTQLDSLGDRLMYRLAFRKTTDHETLLVNHSVDRGDGTVGVRWYEIRSNSGTTLETSRSVFQTGTYSPDNAYRWMGSIAEDKSGNIAVGYSASSGLLAPSILYSGRAAGSSDAPGTLGAESTLQQGGGSETGASRWGDYTSLSLDPHDDCTFWYTNEYFSGNASYSWRTRIASFSFSGCGTTVKTDTTTTLLSSLNPSNVNDPVTFTATVTASGTASGATGTVDFLDGGTSIGTGMLSIGTASFQTSNLAAGSHSITAVYSGDGAYNGSTSAALTQTVNDNTPPPTGSFTLGASPSSVTVARNNSAQFTITVTPAGGFSSDVALSASGVPPQSSVTFNPATVAGGNGTSNVTISIGRNTPRKTYTMTITGTGGGVTASASVTVTVR